MALFFCSKYTCGMDYQCAGKSAFDSGVSNYATKSKSSSHIKPNEKSPGGGSKAKGRPAGGVGKYTGKMGWGKNQAMS